MVEACTALVRVLFSRKGPQHGRSTFTVASHPTSQGAYVEFHTVRVQRVKRDNVRVPSEYR